MKTMNKTLIALSLAMPMVFNTAHANEQETFAERDQSVELIGFGGGAAVGALIGGPVGAVAGAIVGGLVGQVVSVDKQSNEQELIIAEMREQNNQLETFRTRYAENEVELATLKAELNERSVDLDLAMDIQFRTNSSEIEPRFKLQLDEIAALMRQQPQISWDLEGHADIRGNDDYNLALSQQRVQAVFDYLVNQGVDPMQLTQTAYGDQLATEQQGNREGYFFDRRVSLRSMASQATANN
ncbi:sortase-associated OmpA-like protein PdsO [Enterovibrio paralichthyis]|uniref:sortase-associated OmpA-like protein PdsO n=1 Tax=Enterovibrio paralichthyis TaxID=2853805 RepID=UPI001C48E260|nr:sortase-associated OmpA-like protein PdsO [Enterovibrio paralichthyis]MBV7296553.1 sortase-associated OmpA-like protein PdsO [Enterovibrio paralichthyis]